MDMVFTLEVLLGPVCLAGMHGSCTKRWALCYIFRIKNGCDLTENQFTERVMQMALNQPRCGRWSVSLILIMVVGLSKHFWPFVHRGRHHLIGGNRAPLYIAFGGSYSSEWESLSLCSSNSTSKNVSQRYTVTNKDCDRALYYNILKWQNWKWLRCLSVGVGDWWRGVESLSKGMMRSLCHGDRISP